MWRTERQARWFFAAHLQGALGTGAGYVALLLLAYEQLGSAWGATAVLIADLAPAMLLGPLLGGMVDRHGRLRCAIAAELIGALAFAGLVFAHGAVPLLALALLAGLGSALLRPATCALLPAVVTPGVLERRQRPLRRRARDRPADRPRRRRRRCCSSPSPSWCSRSTPSPSPPRPC